MHGKGQRRRLFACFGDIKTLDTIPRDLLLQALQTAGMVSKMMRCIKSICDAIANTAKSVWV